jgi:probable HAF family extracellular repeat protein
MPFLHMFAAILTLVGYAPALAAARLPAQYTISCLGDVQPFAINNLGQICGQIAVTSIRAHACIWTNGSVTDLGTLGGVSSTAKNINDAGEVIGYSDMAGGCRRAFVWKRGHAPDITPNGQSFAMASEVNSEGVVVGLQRAEGQPVSGVFLWGPNNGTWIPSPSGPDDGYSPLINNDDDILQWQRFTPGGKGMLSACHFEFRSKQIDEKLCFTSNLPLIILDLNDKDDVIGETGGPSGNFIGGITHAYLWTSAVLTDIGTLGGHETRPSKLNDSDKIVGCDKDGPAISSKLGGPDSSGPWHAFVWQNGIMRDFNDLIPSGSGWVLEDAIGLNDRGQIIGYGKLNGYDEAYLLTPSKSHYH